MASTFSVLDYCLFVAVLLVSAVVGLYYFLKEKFGKKEMTSDDLLMGGREMSVFPVAMSLVASYMSAITVLGKVYDINSIKWSKLKRAGCFGHFKSIMISFRALNKDIGKYFKFWNKNMLFFSLLNGGQKYYIQNLMVELMGSLLTIQPS